MHVKTQNQFDQVFFFLTTPSECTEFCIPVPVEQPAVGFLLAIPRLTDTGTQQLTLCVRKDTQEVVTKPFADNYPFSNLQLNSLDN